MIVRFLLLRTLRPVVLVLSMAIIGLTRCFSDSLFMRHQPLKLALHTTQLLLPLHAAPRVLRPPLKGGMLRVQGLLLVPDVVLVFLNLLLLLLDLVLLPVKLRLQGARVFFVAISVRGGPMQLLAQRQNLRVQATMDGGHLLLHPLHVLLRLLRELGVLVEVVQGHFVPLAVDGANLVHDEAGRRMRRGRSERGRGTRRRWKRRRKRRSTVARMVTLRGSRAC